MAADYRFLAHTGVLEVRTRAGYKQIAGCSCLGIFEYQDRLRELPELLAGLSDAEAALSIAELYQQHERFRHLCDRVLLLNGVELDWIKPSDLEWLLFGHYDDANNLQPSPLQRLNTPEPPRHPRKESPEKQSDRVTILAAIAAQCESLEEAYRVATSRPSKEVLAVLEESAWQGQSAEEQDDIKFKAWAAQQRKQTAESVGGWANG